MGGETPLHRAATNGHLEVVKKLRTKGADVNALNDDTFTPLSLAALHGKMDVVVFLHESGARLSTPDPQSGRVFNWSPLSAAASRGYKEVAEYIVQKGGPMVLDVQDEDGWTALHYAARNGHEETVRYLKEAGADLRVMDKKSMRAFEMSKTKQISLLLWYGVDSGKADSPTRRGVDHKGSLTEVKGPCQLYQMLAEADNTLSVSEVDAGMKGLSRRLLGEYEAVYELLTHVRVGVLDAGIAAALSAKNQRLADALQHEVDALKVTKRSNTGDYPDRVNVERRLSALYGDMGVLRQSLEEDAVNPERSREYAKENEQALMALQKHAEECLVGGGEGEGGAGAGGQGQ